MEQGRGLGFDAIVIRAGALPGRLKEYALEGGSTVADVATVTGLPQEGEWQINYQPAKLTDVVPNGVTVVRLKPVEGN